VQSQGSLDFSNDHRSGAEWAQLLGTSQANVSRWRAGLLRPGAATRQKIHTAGGPPPDAWDASVGGAAPSSRKRQPKQAAPPKPKKKAKRKPGGATAAAVAAEADLWLQELEDFRAEIPTLARDARARAAMLAKPKQAPVASRRVPFRPVTQEHFPARIMLNSARFGSERDRQKSRLRIRGS
jgi:hypothetical protein